MQTAQAPDQRFRVAGKVEDRGLSGLSLGTYSLLPCAALRQRSPRRRPLTSGFAFRCIRRGRGPGAAQGTPRASALLNAYGPLPTRRAAGSGRRERGSSEISRRWCVRQLCRGRPGHASVAACAGIQGRPVTALGGQSPGAVVGRRGRVVGDREFCGGRRLPRRSSLTKPQVLFGTFGNPGPRLPVWFRPDRRRTGSDGGRVVPVGDGG